MDAPKMPDIKPEVQTAGKDEEEEKKKGGFFANLLSSLNGGAGAGTGGIGGLAGGLGGAAGAGGILATKAGIVGLIMIGTTIAGGLGVVGYKAFGPGSSDKVGRTVSLFESRPKSAPVDYDEEGAKSAANGNSASLDYLVKANAGSSAAGEAGKADASAAGASDPAAASASADAQKVIGDGGGGKANVGGNKAASLKSDKKFGELSKVGGSGGGGSSGASFSANSNLAKAATGNLTGLGGRATARAGATRGVGGRRGAANAFQQAQQVRGDQKPGRSSQQAGATYDGGSASGITSDGAGAAGGAGQGADTPPSNTPTNAGSTAGDRFPSPPPATPKNVTPWQKAIMLAAGLLAVATLIMIMVAKAALTSDAATILTPGMKALLMAGAAIAGVLALAAVAIGAMIAGGKYGQKMQGTMFMLSGGLLALSAGTFIAGMASLKAGTDTLAKFGGGFSAVLVVSGALGIGALIGGFLSAPKKYKAKDFEGGKPPDLGNTYHRAPSQEALSRFVV